MGKKSWSIDYSNVDWTKSNAQIARELNINTSSVWSKRKILGIDPSSLRNKGMEILSSGAKIDWDNSKRTKINGYRRTLIRLQCPACKTWRLTAAVTIGKIRKGSINYCQECIFDQRGQQSQSGKKGIRKTSYGYIRRHLKTFSQEEQKLLKPMAENWSPVIGEHRAVMALHLGRTLSSNEIVHHKNGNKIDNRIENLQIVNSADHRREHVDILLELTFLRDRVQKLELENKELKKTFI